MSTITFSPAATQQALPLRFASRHSTAWPAARAKCIAMRVLQIALVSLLLASIPDDSGPIRHQAPVAVSGASFARTLAAADR